MDDPLDEARLIAAAYAARTARAEYRRLARLPNGDRGENWREVWGAAVDAMMASERELLCAGLGLPRGSHVE